MKCWGCCCSREVCCAAYFKSIRNARRMGALTGFAHGTAAAKDPHAQGTLRLQENIIEYVIYVHLYPRICFKEWLRSIGPYSRPLCARYV